MTFDNTVFNATGPCVPATSPEAGTNSGRYLPKVQGNTRSDAGQTKAAEAMPDTNRGQILWKWVCGKLEEFAGESDFDGAKTFVSKYSKTLGEKNTAVLLRRIEICETIAESEKIRKEKGLDAAVAYLNGRSQDLSVDVSGLKQLLALAQEAEDDTKADKILAEVDEMLGGNDEQRTILAHDIISGNRELLIRAGENPDKILEDITAMEQGIAESVAKEVENLISKIKYCRTAYHEDVSGFGQTAVSLLNRHFGVLARQPQVLAAHNGFYAMLDEVSASMQQDDPKILKMLDDEKKLYASVMEEKEQPSEAPSNTNNSDGDRSSVGDGRPDGTGLAMNENISETKDIDDLINDKMTTGIKIDMGELMKSINMSLENLDGNSVLKTKNNSI